MEQGKNVILDLFEKHELIMKGKKWASLKYSIGFLEKI